MLNNIWLWDIAYTPVQADINNSDPRDYSDNYFDLKIKLEEMLDRPVDLLESKAVKNPYLKKQIDNTKMLVYGR